MGSSRRQTVGYKYYLGLHFAICYGPVDLFRRILCGGRVAWAGAVSTNETIEIDEPSLFGGKKREGGIQGDLDVMMGGPSQTANAYLSDQIGGLIPAFRGILSAVYNGGLISANNPYVKPWAFEVQRILTGWHGGSAWYPEKAEISFDDFSIGYDEDGWKYKVEAAGSGADYSAADYDDSSWATGPGGIGSGGPGAGFGVGTFVPAGEIGKSIWIRRAVEARSGATVQLDIYHDDFPHVYWNGEQVTDLESLAYFHSRGEVSGADVVTNNVIAVKVVDSIPTGTPDNIYAGVTITVDATPWAAMNPAHIVYQCLTDPTWGMGYPTSQIDDASFTEAADTFYAEGMGLCLLWNQQSDIEDFIQTVLDHAGAVYYADPKTGKFKLKALRADYDPEYLNVYDESSILSVDNFQRPGYGETVNEITVVYRDHYTSKDSSITVQDLANIQAQGAVVSQTRQYPGFPLSTLAARVAERDLLAASTPLAKCRITVNRSAWQEAPGGVIKVNWDKLGLEGVVFRVLTINYGTLEAGQLVIELAEDVYGLPSSSYSTQEPTEFTPPDITPSQITVQTVIETPYWDIARALTAADLSFLDADSAYIQAAASTTNPVSLGFEMFTRISPADYVSADASGTFAPTALVGGSVGVLKQDTVIEYTADVNIDDVLPGQRALIGTGRTAEFVEIVEVAESASELEVRRGILDTLPQEHVGGTRIWFIEDDFAVDSTERATSDSVDVKLSAYSGGGETSVDAATAMNIVPDQRLFRPYPPGKVRINGQAYPDEITSTITVTWAHRDRLQQLVNYVDHEENSIGPEAGTTYNLRVYLDSDLVYTENGMSGTSSTLYEFAGVSGLGRIELESVRDSVTSWQVFEHEFAVTTDIDPLAISIYGKLDSGDWFTCESATSPIVGAHNATSAAKIGTGATSATPVKIANGIDITPNALYRATASLPWTATSGSVYAMGCWVNADSVATVCPFVIGQSNNQNGEDRALAMYLMPTGLLKARAGREGTGSFTDADTSAGTISTGVNYFIQAERGTNYVRCRINGGSWVSVALTTNVAPQTNMSVSIGSDYNSGSSTFLQPFDGRVDEAFFMEGTLTDAEWDYLYNSGSGISYLDLKAAAGES